MLLYLSSVYENKLLPKAFQTTNFGMADFVGIPNSSPYPKPLTFVRGFVANIVLHSNRMWRDLRELHKLAKLFKMLKINDFDQNKRDD